MQSSKNITKKNPKLLFFIAQMIFMCWDFFLHTASAGSWKSWKVRFAKKSLEKHNELARAAV